MLNQMFINGRWVSAPTAFVVRDPATWKPITEVSAGRSEDMQTALAAASDAWIAWRELGPKQRATILAETARIIRTRREELAGLITLEQGKPVGEARTETDTAADFFDWYAGEALRVYGAVIPSWNLQKRLVTTRHPLGVVLAVTPWNFPAAMIARKVAPALAAGCTVVAKPAEQTPLTALYLAECLQDAGLPDGVFNVIPTDDPAVVVGSALANPVVRKVSFTGSNEVGRLIFEQAARHYINVSLELGGSSPFLVFADADLPCAVTGAIQSKFRNAGQTCVCSNRIYVERTVLEEFVERFTDQVRTLRVGRGQEAATDIGPVIDAEGYAKIRHHVHDAVQEGASIVCGTLPPKRDTGPFFLEPVVLTHVHDRMRVAAQETFGPVAPILAFDTEQEAVVRANQTPYGLAAYVYTRNLSRATRVSEQLEYGVVGLNDAVPATPQAPFGGIKASGLGREGGREGIEEFLFTKFISMGV